ncbi:MAG: hypothetical protein WD534_14780 [Phycisphaeraceae bacterium]
MTKQRKVLAAILGTGLMALGVDRFVLESSATTPQAASAVAPAVDTPSVQEQALDLAREALDESNVSQRASLADRLNETARQHALPDRPHRDAFAPSATWTDAIAPTEPVEAVDDDRARRFKQNHALNAVMTPGERGVVVVNGKPLRVGGQLDGFTLVSVQGQSATFEGPVGQVVLTIAPSD